MTDAKSSPTGRVQRSSPELQFIRPPLSEAQRETVLKLRQALSEHKPDSPVHADMAHLEARILSSMSTQA